MPKETHLRTKYDAQRKRAAKRGIGWEITFQEWVEWWGDDISRRGVGHDKLQMQRIADAGPYRLDNIRKGYPRDNSKTAGLVKANKRQATIRRFRKIRADAFASILKNRHVGVGGPPPTRQIPEIEKWAKWLCRTNAGDDPVAESPEILTPRQKPALPPKPPPLRRTGFLGRRIKVP